MAFVLSGVRLCRAIKRADARCSQRVRVSSRRCAVRMAATLSEVLTAPESGLSVTTNTGDVQSFSGDFLVIALPEQKDVESYELPEAVKSLDETLNGAIGELVKENDFKGKAGSKATARIFGTGASFKYIACYGLGAADKPKAMRDLGSFATSSAKSMKGVQTVGIHIQDPSDQQAQNIVEGAITAGYSDMRFKKANPDEPSPSNPSIELLGINDGSVFAGQSVSSGVLMAKQLVDAPANIVTPTILAETAEKIASEHGMEVQILDKDKCEEMGMGSYLAVAKAAVEPPKFIHLTYKPEEPKKKVVIIGKGLTFDSGGYNLKAGAGSMIEKMKLDMGGAAAALGAAKVIGQMKPEHVEVHFIVASCENMVSGDGMKPGDIITASNGTTIEVLNTDAEGRLTLADALIYAENLGDVDYIVDLATLTGAIIISLGSDVAGMWSSSDELSDRLTSAADAAGEKMWRMPLVEEYKEMIKGKISDLKNIGGRGAGSITAALFLQEFVKKTPWAHLDIAGTAYTDKENATGYGVRTLVEMIRKLEGEAL